MLRDARRPDSDPRRRPLMTLATGATEGVHPPLDSPGVRVDRAAGTRAGRRWSSAAHAHRGDRAGCWASATSAPLDADLTRQHAGEPLGERIIVHGRVLDGDGRPVPHTLVEVWQANAAGRYRARPSTGTRRRWTRTSPAPAGASPTTRAATGSSPSSPGAYPWRNHHNAWRPAHIHFSLFGRAFVQRLVTQMYFPGDPLFGQDPIFNSVPDPAARERHGRRVRPGRDRAGVGAGLPVRHRAARPRGDPVRGRRRGRSEPTPSG